MTTTYPFPSPKTNIPQIETKELQAFILKRRLERVSFPEIAGEIGRTQGYVYKLYKKALRGMLEEPAKQLIKLESRKLDQLEVLATRLMTQFYPMVSSGRIIMIQAVENNQPLFDDEGKPVMLPLQDIKPQLDALNATLKIMERRARLLGLDKPTKTAFTDPSGENGAPVAHIYLPDNGRDGVIEGESQREEP